MTEYEGIFFRISGGLFQGIIFLSLCLFNKDEENRLVNKMIAIQGFVYMFFEGFLHSTWWSIGGAVALIASFVYLGYVLVKSNPDL